MDRRTFNKLISAGSESITLNTSVLGTKAEAGLAVLADVAQQATFPESEVALARRNAADHLKEQGSDPSFLAQRALAYVLFGRHPYSVVALTQDAIDRTTAEKLRYEYALRFRPDQAILVVVGDFDSAKMMSSVESLLGKWIAPPAMPLRAVDKPTYVAPTPSTVWSGLTPFRRQLPWVRWGRRKAARIMPPQKLPTRSLEGCSDRA